MWSFWRLNPRPTLAEYLFIDRPRLRGYVDQIKGPLRREAIPTWDVSLSPTGPTVMGRQTRSSRPHTDHEMVEVVVKYLRRHNLLASDRPQHHHDVAKVFVLERTEAQKVILPVPRKGTSTPLKEIAVWVSGPGPEQLTGSGYSEGTFLYLLEAYWDSDSPCMTTYSSFSALNVLIGELATKTILVDVPEPFLERPHPGLPLEVRRLNWLSPIDSLRTLGGEIQPPRQIETLYRKRYLSDEKVFEDDKGRHRCNDLFAYPIYIREGTV